MCRLWKTVKKVRKNQRKNERMKRKDRKERKYERMNEKSNIGRKKEQNNQRCCWGIFKVNIYFCLENKLFYQILMWQWFDVGNCLKLQNELAEVQLHQGSALIAALFSAWKPDQKWRKKRLKMVGKKNKHFKDDSFEIAERWNRKRKKTL